MIVIGMICRAEWWSLRESDGLLQVGLRLRDPKPDLGAVANRRVTLHSCNHHAFVFPTSSPAHSFSSSPSNSISITPSLRSCRQQAPYFLDEQLIFLRLDRVICPRNDDQTRVRNEVRNALRLGCNARCQLQTGFLMPSLTWWANPILRSHNDQRLGRNGGQVIAIVKVLFAFAVQLVWKKDLSTAASSLKTGPLTMSFCPENGTAVLPQGSICVVLFHVKRSEGKHDQTKLLVVLKRGEYLVQHGQRCVWSSVQAGLES